MYIPDSDFKGGNRMEAILSVKNLNKSFGSRSVIRNVSFDVYGGEIFGFLGPNGAGKTTTIKMIMGFLFPDSGEISICNMNLKKQYEKAMNLVGGIVENPEMYKEDRLRKPSHVCTASRWRHGSTNPGGRGFGWYAKSSGRKAQEIFTWHEAANWSCSGNCA